MITIGDVRIFKMSNDKRLKETDILLYIKKILNERKELPYEMELKFIY